MTVLRLALLFAASTGLAIANAGAPPHAAPGAFANAAAAYLVLVDGVVIWERDADARRAPASLAKLMTALLVLEDGTLDEELRISAAAAAARGTRLGLRAGEPMAARALLAATLIASANDACHALAERAAGVAAFVRRMNARARELSLRATRFAGPCGFDAEGQHSTARDLARLAQAVLREPLLAELVSRREIELSTADGARQFRLRNTNALLEHFPGAAGVKTGRTRRAGANLIALAERDGRRVLLVMLGARDRWWDAHAILSAAFDASASRGAR